MRQRESKGRHQYRLVPFADVCIANEEDAEMFLEIKVDDNDVEGGKLNEPIAKAVTEKMCEQCGRKDVAFTEGVVPSAEMGGTSCSITI